MARCEDCIHGEVCRRFCYSRIGICGDNADERCRLFSPATTAPRAYVAREIIQAKYTNNSEGFQYKKKELIFGDCFHGEIWYRCPYCLAGIEAHSIPKNRICHRCGLEYILE